MIFCARATRGLRYKKVKFEVQVEQQSIRLDVFSTLNLDLSLTFRRDARSKGHSLLLPFAATHSHVISMQAHLSCSSGSFGLSGLSGLFGSFGWFTGPTHQTDQIDQIDQTNRLPLSGVAPLTPVPPSAPETNQTNQPCVSHVPHVSPFTLIT
jgi:hypothetical protein